MVRQLEELQKILRWTAPVEYFMRGTSTFVRYHGRLTETTLLTEGFPNCIIKSFYSLYICGCLALTTLLMLSLRAALLGIYRVPSARDES